MNVHAKPTLYTFCYPSPKLELDQYWPQIYSDCSPIRTSSIIFACWHSTSSTSSLHLTTISSTLSLKNVSYLSIISFPPVACFGVNVLNGYLRSRFVYASVSRQEVRSLMPSTLTTALNPLGLSRPFGDTSPPSTPQILVDHLLSCSLIAIGR